MTISSWGYNGACLVMIGHGLCSSGLCCLANISYERAGSRSVVSARGMLSFIPSVTLWLFLLAVCNMATPPSLSLFGEIFLLGSFVCWSWYVVPLLALVSFFSACYTLYMYSSSQHGSYYTSVFSSFSGSLREYCLLFLHWIPLNFLVLSEDILLI